MLSVEDGSAATDVWAPPRFGGMPRLDRLKQPLPAAVGKCD